MGRGNYEPIKRSTLMLSKYEGGLGVTDISHKSRSILVSSFIKFYLSDSSMGFIADYYNFIRLGQLLNKNTDPGNVSYTGTVYYKHIVETIQKCIHIKGFPVINAKQIYFNILTN